MDYAFLRFNDELKINIDGLGLAPAISLYPELWELYLEKLNVSINYLNEIISGLNGKKNRAKLLEDELKILMIKIKRKTLSLGLSPIIAVTKIGEKGDDVIVRNLVTNEIFYVAKAIFKNNITNEFDIKKYESGEIK